MKVREEKIVWVFGHYLMDSEVILLAHMSPAWPFNVEETTKKEKERRKKEEKEGYPINLDVEKSRYHYFWQRL